MIPNDNDKKKKKIVQTNFVVGGTWRRGEQGRRFLMAE